MRRLIAILLLLLPSVALGAKGMVVELPGFNSGSRDHNSSLATLWNTAGMDVDYYSASSVKTLWLINCQAQRNPEGTVTQYDYLIIENYQHGLGGGGAAGANFDSLFRDPSGNPRWFAKPTAILSDPAVGGFNWLGPPTTGADSLGFGGNPAPTSYLFPVRVQYSPMLQRGWHSPSQGMRFSRIAAPGVTRDILLDLPGPWWPYRQLTPNGLWNGWSTPDWDSVGTLSASDSGAVRVRYRADGNGNGLPPPVVVAGLGQTYTANVRTALICAAILDSACANTVLYQKRPGPITFTVQCNTIGASGRYDAEDVTGIIEDYGIFVPQPGDSDRIGALSTIDALQSRGVKMSFGVQMNPDSVAVYRYQLEWIRDRYPLAKVYPFERSGLGDFIAGGNPESAGGNADATHNYDAFGAMRNRSLLPAGCSDPRLGCDCSTDTSSVLCNALRQKKAVTDFYGADRLDRVWSVPLEDWTPKYIGRSVGSIDSLAWILHQFVGLRGLRIGNHALANIANDGQTNSPRGWFRHEVVWPVKDPATGTLLGTFAFLPSRAGENGNARQIQAASHDNASEFLCGLTTGMWFPGTPSPIYVNGHEFFSRTMIFEAPASWLGGSGDPRYEWHAALNYIGDFDDFQKLANRLAGRTVIRMSYGEDTADWFIRSGLR
jgi:hypothetical protein